MAQDMREVPEGTFQMGSADFYPEERPVHLERVAGFAMDEHPVTNAEFRRFVTDSGHLTTAETAPDATDFPGADPADLVPGSLVFVPTPGPVPLDDWRRWWRWTPGASWLAPTGPGSDLAGLDDHPVVHVSFEDALAYAAWSGKQLPSEVEWEYAARAGGDHTAYAWGDQLMPGGRAMANTWHGRFPWENLAPAGHQRTTPVGHYPPNPWGLVDLIGNVWEWTTSAWTDDHAARVGLAEAAALSPEPTKSCCGPPPVREEDQRVMKGGSHLCSPSYCQRYRPAARQGQAVRSSTSHLGFRCVLR